MGMWGGQGERVAVVCRVVSEDFGRSHLNKDLKTIRESHMVILKNIPGRGESQSRSPKVFLESPRNSE